MQYQLTVELRPKGVSFSCEMSEGEAAEFATAAGMPWPAEASTGYHGSLVLRLNQVDAAA